MFVCFLHIIIQQGIRESVLLYLGFIISFYVCTNGKCLCKLHWCHYKNTFCFNLNWKFNFHLPFSVFSSFLYNLGQWNLLKYNIWLLKPHRSRFLYQQWIKRLCNVTRVVTNPQRIITGLCSSPPPCRAFVLAVFWFYGWFTSHSIVFVCNRQLFSVKNSKNTLNTTCSAPNSRRTELATSWWTYWSI